MSDEDAADMPDYQPGMKVEGTEWVVKKKLGEGGFGRVYEVKNDAFPDKRAALKLEVIEEAVTVMRELHVLQNYRHSNIPEYFENLQCTDLSLTFIQLLGLDLIDMQARMRARVFDEATTFAIGMSVFRALKFLHDGGIVHRDVKPENIMTGCEDEPQKHRNVFLIDFGLTGLCYSDDRKKWREDCKWKNFTGTKYYASPAAHDYCTQYPRDDCIGLVYSLAETGVGCLPWDDKDIDAKAMVEMKKGLNLRHLFENSMGDHFLGIVDSVSRLGPCQHLDLNFFEAQYARFCQEKGVKPVPDFEPDWTDKKKWVPAKTVGSIVVKRRWASKDKASCKA